ncbi:MAG: hypothetical protein IJA88_05615 [Clostridia bacterium]|nr:hypothetical protein [Clostridia bacterium]
MMDLFFEILLEVYMELMMLIVPEKNVTKVHRFFGKLIAIIMLFIIFGLAIYGVILLVDYGNKLGIIPLTIAIIISIVQIILGIIFYKKHH